MSDPVDIHNIYPSIDELVPARFLHELPHSLVENIAKRYAELGGKYMIDEWHTDRDRPGPNAYSYRRQVNNIIHCDNALSTQEELIDAVFNWLAWVFTENGRVNAEDVSDDMVVCLQAMTRAYVIVSKIMVERVEEASRGAS